MAMRVEKVIRHPLTEYKARRIKTLRGWGLSAGEIYRRLNRDRCYVDLQDVQAVVGRQ